jgi:transcriptional regulator with XRE-family HTH domain
MDSEKKRGNMFRLKVKEVAQAKAVSQRQLFLKSGVDIRIIRKIFRNPHTVVTVETLARLAAVLEVDVSELIESSPKEEQGLPDET